MPTREGVAARVDLAHEVPFTLGPIHVEPAHRRICRDDRELILEPKVMRVLTALGRSPGTILSRDDLIETCWDGRIVGDSAVDRAISLLRTALREMAADKVALETIARVGYRILVDPSVEPQLDEALPHARPAGRFRRWQWIALAMILLVLGGAGAWMLRQSQEPVAIAVMPFRALTPGEEYFADGLGQEIASQLATEPALRVAGRSSTEMFARSATDVGKIGEGLGVNFLLEGSVRREGARVRIDVNLTRTSDGISQWSRVFDGELKDVLSMQRDLGRAVLAGLHREVSGSRPEEAALSTSGELYREYLTSLALMRERDRPKILQAKFLLEEITRLDPGFAPAWAQRAKAESMQYLFDPAYSAEKQAASDRLALSFVNRAITLAPELPQAYAARALVQYQNGIAAIPDLQRAVELEPSDAEAWYWLGNALKQDSRFEEAATAYRRVAELDPYWVRGEVAAPFLWDMGEREEARAQLQRVIDFAPEGSQREAARARMATWRGDWSGFILHSNEAMKLTSNFEQQMIWGIARNGRLARLGIPFEVVAVPHPSIHAIQEALAGNLPSLERIASSHGGEREFWNGPVHPYLFPRLLLNAGRSADLVHLYDVPFGSPQAMDEALGIFLVDVAPDLAVGLQREGRAREASELLARAAARIERTRQFGPLPGSFEERVARVYAAQGQREKAIASLRRAVARGWPNNHYGDLGAWLLPPFDTEPAYVAIKDDPWVRELDGEIQRNLAKEREEALHIDLFYPRPSA
ncbi:winged helix-turn-helix domain-containing protein [Aurantiacibacter hainanensis]|uniref:winged helix-turn-helix domain-containing protein n=1 Tax=Aurantiacibacter hainanensis TaxID=3076114 RepID=UPI0030C72A8A